MVKGFVNFMKDYCKIKENKNGTKSYYNEYNYLHRLNGPAIEYENKSKDYLINNINYMFFDYKYNTLFIYSNIIELLYYDIYIKQNIKELMQKYNPQFDCHFFYNKNQLNDLPDYIII